MKRLKFRKTDHVDLLKETIKWNEVARLGTHNFSKKAKDLQMKCLVEELTELIEACDAEDHVEALDAMCDIIFVAIYGDFLSGGGDINYNIYECSYGQINTFEGHAEGNELRYLRDVAESLKDLAETGEVGDDVYKYATSAFSNIGLLFFDMDFKGAYEEVVRSNFTKFPSTADVMLGAEITWFDTTSKYDDVCVEEYDGRYIFRCDGGDGKIVKPRLFKEPELEQYLSE